MRAITTLLVTAVIGGIAAVQACTDVSVDPTGGNVPPAGVIRGTVSYNGPPPCSQGGHVVGNAVVLVFDARNPPPPSGLANTALNFGVVAGDALFHDWPVTQGATKICPEANSPTMQASAPYVISPMAAGQYVIQAFFDYTGDFFATFKFRNLPEATDVGGGYFDINDAQELIPAGMTSLPNDGGLVPYSSQPRQDDPNYILHSLTVNVGTESGASSTSLRNVPLFTMPSTGYLADNVNVTISVNTMPTNPDVTNGPTGLTLARPYFYPEGSALPAQTTPSMSPTGVTYGGSSATRPTTPLKTPQNPTGDVDFEPVLTFPQDIQIYAQPSILAASFYPTSFDQYQEAFPELVLHAGVPAVEQPYAADTSKASNPFHMQLGIPDAPANYAPGGNGGIYVWWNGTQIEEDCNGIPGCTPELLGQVPENSLIKRMWPLIVLAKLNDLPSGTTQPNPNDPEELIAQGTDLTKPIVIVQGITLAGDSVFNFAQGGSCTGADCTATSDPSNHTVSAILPYPDFKNHTNLQDHVTVLLRPSVLCLDPRAPDQGGVLVTPGTLVPTSPTNSDIVVKGPYPPGDQYDNPKSDPAVQGIVVDSQILSNPQLATLVNTKAQGSSNGLIGACLPPGRYQVNMVYPTGQAWTTPNEEGSCASLEGTTLLNGTGPGFDPGNCSSKPRPVLYSQGTRAVVEITPTESATNCKSASPTGGAIAAVPFACTSLCDSPSQDPTANPPCSKPLPAH
jgi:hypothetical protein